MYTSDVDPILLAIRRATELRDTEFKESQPFQALRWKIVKAAMGMANLRNGGRIIIGVSQRDGALHADGMSEEHRKTYDPDDVIEAINRHARPAVNCIVRVVAEDDNRQFIAIEVQPFDRIPVLCRRGSPDGVPAGDRLVSGAIYMRSEDRIATTQIVDADLMAELLEIAADRGAAQIVSRAQRAGFRVPNAERERLRDVLLEVLGEGDADRVLDAIAQFNRRPSTGSVNAFERERKDFWK